MQVFKRWGFVGLTLILAAGWSFREVVFALDGPKQLTSATINLDQVEMVSSSDKGADRRQKWCLPGGRHTGFE